MKVKLVELVNSKEVLNELINSDIPVQTSYKLSCYDEDINSELTAYEKTRIKLVKKYGRDIGGGNFEVNRDDKESLEKFVNDINPVLETEVDLKDVSKIDISDLGNNFSISPNKLKRLHWLFK